MALETVFAWLSEHALLALALIVLLNCAHRVFLQARDPMTFDSWGHLYLTFAVQRSGRGPFQPIRPQVIGAQDFYYPLLPHWTYSHLPNGFLLRHNRLINPLIETAFLGISIGLALLAGLPAEWAMLGALGYVFTPLWFTKLMIGPRVLNFTTRLFSEVLYPLALGVLLLAVPIPDWLAVGIGAALLAAVLLGSKFGVQVVVFVTPLTALFAASIKVAIAWVLAFLLAQLVSKGNFASQVRQQVAHLVWYASELREGRMPIQARNAIKHLRQWSPDKSLAQNVRRLVFVWFARNSITGVILRAPHFVATAILAALALVGGEAIPTPFGPLVASAAAIYALTSLKYFLFIGQAERYLSHVSIWSNMLFVALCATQGLMVLVWLAIAYGLAISLGERLFLRGSVDPEAKRSEHAAMDYLESAEQERTVLVYPYHAVPPYRIMIQTPHTCLLPWMSGEAHKTAMKGLEDYPRVDLSRLEQSAELRDVDTLIVDRTVREEFLPQWGPPTGWHMVERNFGKLEIYERTG
ncbi:MAG: hypothetical protein WA985_12820 [Erythrobacter sp.]|uniref:hypothetical protein n=1 Tax=Erythrobacter sp. TaxID=1042 RepID=UPI003C778A18